MTSVWSLREEKWDHRLVVRLIFDDASRPVNILTPEAMESLHELLVRLEGNPPSAVVLESAKPGIFIAGADINLIVKIAGPADAAALARHGRDILWKLHTMGCPTFAAIDGVALGGGLETALFCDYRVVSDSPKTKLGLPEVNLGIIPGFGGTQTLPRLIGLRPALDLILTGRQIDGRRAEKLGLADRCVPHDIFADQLKTFVLTHPKKSRWPRRSPPFFLTRAVICSLARREILKKTQGNYPAPTAALEAVRRGLPMELSEGLKIETGIFSDLPGTFQCKNLIRTFFQTEKFKKYSLPDSRGGHARALPGPVRGAAVIGAGTMGAGIAQHLASCGIHVRLKDIEPKFLQKGMASAQKTVKAALQKKRIRREEARDISARISPALDYGPIRAAEVVIEAVLEDLPLKKKVFADLERVVSPETILATNTSSLPIGKIAEGAGAAASRGRYIGLHFFNPVEKMPLVEIVVATCTSDETVERALEFVKQIRKTPVIVRDRPGFLVNRILMPYLNEAAHLFSEGVRMDHIDKVALRFGMPMGPLNLLDVIGLDVSQKVAGVLHAAYGDRMCPSPILDRMCKEGRLGRKSEKGFYVYSGKKKYPDESLYAGIPNPPDFSNEDIADRLVLTMVNEAARILEEQVAADPETVDVGMLLGAGFPPFRGGLLKYADDRGLQNCVNRLYALSERHGARFAPCDRLVRLATDPGRFHMD